MLRQTIKWMAPVLAASLMVVAAGEGTAMYRSVDKSGVPHYSDRPSPGAKLIVVGSSPRSAEETQPTEPVIPPPAVAPAAPVQQEASTGYSVCEIAQPTPEQMFINVESVTVSLRLEPALQAGHKAYAIFDGKRVNGSSSFTLSPVFRGMHTVSVVVENERGAVVCHTKSVTFYARQPSVIPLRERGRRNN
jgi:hypothetical protein